MPSSLASGIASNVCLRTFSSPFNLRPASRHRTCGNHHTIRMAQDPTTPAPPWHAAFPAPQHTAPAISREEVMPSLSSPDLLLVDVRRTDYEGGTIKGSINLPAQSFYMNRGVLHDLCKRAGVKKVVFYCGKCILRFFFKSIGLSVTLLLVSPLRWSGDRIRDIPVLIMSPVLLLNQRL